MFEQHIINLKANFDNKTVKFGKSVGFKLSSPFSINLLINLAKQST